MRQKMLLGLKAALGLFLFAVGLICCINSPAIAKNRIVIRIGTHLPLSGSLASLGKEQLWAYKAAVEDVNKTGGVFTKEVNAKLPVELNIIDDESDPSKAAVAVENLITRNKVDFIISGQAAPFGVIPGCIVAEKYEKYYHASACVVSAWKEQEFKYATLLWYDTTQGTSIPFHIYKSMMSETQIEKPALFMEDTFDGRSMNGILKKNAEEMGYKIGLEEYCTPGSGDYTAQIIKAKTLGIDAIILFANTADSVTFIRQMKENDLNVKSLFCYKGTMPTEFYESMGKDGNYIMTDSVWHENMSFKGAKKLGERYRKEFGKTSTIIGRYYGLAQVLCQAIEKADSLEASAIKKAVLSGSFDTVAGKVTYAKDGVAIFTLAASQWINGDQVLIYPFEWAGNNKVQPIPKRNKR